MDASYLHGRTVVGVLTGDQALAHDNAHWVVELEGGGFICCFDDKYDAPDLTDLAFTTSETTPTEVRLYFGTDQNPHGTLVMFRPDASYGVSDAVYSGGVIERPSVDTVQEAVESPVAASNMGIENEGPTEEYLAAEAERQAQAEEERQALAEEDDGA